ncbi:hypothetical protein AAFC00_006719 [Neodothiora populina]|uniref:PDZ GRASP-type domain-containing protein n=1 Tax=Neodothiora populina TaxID=2781224 RepID=A0ABR3PAX9_9PEZI
MANVFGALNRFISRLDSDPQAQRQQSGAQGAYGFHVLRNNNAELPLEPWFDFIIGINGRTLDSSDPNLFAAEIRNCAGSNISLGVYCAKGQQIREIYVAVPAETQSLGISLQWSPLACTEDVWHILDVIPNSPADVAGLLPYSDYVIGSPEGLMRGENGLGEIIEDFMNRPLRLYVYNHEYDVTRMITITPHRHWGGDGALGCVLGFGALHRVPAALSEPANAPGETMFETARFSNEESSRPSFSIPSHPAASPAPALHTNGGDFLVPANMQFNTTAPPAALDPSQGPVVEKKPKKARAHAAISPSAMMDDYFKEGEQKSMELDNAPKGTNSALPPPPKGGPPKSSKSPAPPSPASEAE